MASFTSNPYLLAPDAILQMKRRGLSIILVEVVLMVVAIVAALALGGFVFGLFGHFMKSANVTVTSAACSSENQTATDCILLLTNVGSVNAGLDPSSYLLVYHGQSSAESYSKACVGQGGDQVVAGSNRVVWCTFNVAPGSPGDDFEGWVGLTDGQNIPFAGHF